MTISNSRDVNCRANAPGLWPLTISLGANPSILLQLGGGLYSIESETTEIRTRADVVSPKSGRLSPVLPGSITTSLAGSVSRFGAHPTHRGPGAADFGGAKGMEGARLQSARAPRFAPLAERRPTEQRRFVRLLAGPHQSGAIIGGIQWSPSLGDASP